MDNEIQNNPQQPVQGQSPNSQYIQPTTGREVVVHNPDAFDVGTPSQGYGQQVVRQDSITEIVTNPNRVLQQFDLTEKQLDNIIAAITGIGAGVFAGLSSKHLKNMFGEEFAGLLGGAVGGYLGGYAGKRIVRGRKRNRWVEY